MAKRIYSFPMTSAFDGLAHEIADEVFEAGDGLYVALCGTEVRPTPATAPIGRACEPCLDQLIAPGPARIPWSVTVPEQNRGQARHRRRGRLQTFLTQVGRSR